jgi:hypothetical protein
LQLSSADKLREKIRQNDAGQVRLQGKWYFHQEQGMSGPGMIKTQPSPDSYRDCLILQGKGKAVGKCVSQCGKRSLSDYLIFGSFYQEKEQIASAAAMEGIGSEHCTRAKAFALTLRVPV